MSVLQKYEVEKIELKTAKLFGACFQICLNGQTESEKDKQKFRLLGFAATPY